MEHLNENNMIEKMVEELEQREEFVQWCVIVYWYGIWLPIGVSL